MMQSKILFSIEVRTFMCVVIESENFILSDSSTIEKYTNFQFAKFTT